MKHWSRSTLCSRLQRPVKTTTTINSVSTFIVSLSLHQMMSSIILGAFSSKHYLCEKKNIFNFNIIIQQIALFYPQVAALNTHTHTHMLTAIAVQAKCNHHHHTYTGSPLPFLTLHNLIYYIHIHTSRISGIWLCLSWTVTRSVWICLEGGKNSRMQIPLIDYLRPISCYYFFFFF